MVPNRKMAETHGMSSTSRTRIPKAEEGGRYSARQKSSRRKKRRTDVCVVVEGEAMRNASCSFHTTASARPHQPVVCIITVKNPQEQHSAYNEAGRKKVAAPASRNE